MNEYEDEFDEELDLFEFGNWITQSMIGYVQNMMSPRIKNKKQPLRK